MKGSGGTISAAVANTDYLPVNAPAATGASTMNGGSGTAISASSSGGSPTVVVTDTFPGSGAAIELIGDGANPNKYIRATAGNLQILNSAGTAVILQLSDAGGFYLPNLPTSSSPATGSMCWSSSGGYITVDTSLACLSSTIRVKEHVLGLDDGINTVMALRPVSYDLKPEFNPEHLGRQVGLIAEEVQKVDPRLIGTHADGSVAGVRYMQLTAVLVKAIQQQQKQINKLTRKLRGVK
jgi:hypothetical protein